MVPSLPGPLWATSFRRRPEPAPATRDPVQKRHLVPRVPAFQPISLCGRHSPAAPPRPGDATYEPHPSAPPLQNLTYLYKYRIQYIPIFSYSYGFSCVLISNLLLTCTVFVLLFIRAKQKRLRFCTRFVSLI